MFTLHTLRVFDVLVNFYGEHRLADVLSNGIFTFDNESAILLVEKGLAAEATDAPQQ
jgi:hypothetical protein